MDVRKAEIRDIAEIRELFRDTIRTVNAKDYTPEQIECWVSCGNGDDVWTERINSQYFIVAETEGRIVGFCSLRSDGYLHSLFVHKDFQGVGVSSKLLQNIEEYAGSKEIKELVADVSITSRGYFESKGYVVIKRQTVCIGIAMDNYCMMKKL